MTIIKQIENWFKAAVPNPTPKYNQVELGFLFKHLDRAMKAHTLFVSKDCRWSVMSYLGKKTPSEISTELMENGNDIRCTDKHLLAKSLAKIIFASYGLAYMNSIDIEGALNEVNRSNWSKFVDGKPVFDENGKIKKGDGYT